ncbi:Rv3654c family TadE-like protein [Leifsonia poae]|uniref:Rv3654c family TadE-like protein n=1 Tax=Leifsonia poae TaxID=110933 RepID=UPI0022F25FFF|nr:Rv3654c family TadE-like protein [Leifsonia poae]
MSVGRRAERGAASVAGSERGGVSERGPASEHGLASENGSASVLVVGIAGALVGLTAGGVAVAGAFVAAQRAAGAADTAALAAADVASGAVPGYPCTQAASIAEANGASLVSCDLDGLVVTVTASVPYLGLSAEARARAGPPGSG